MLPKIIVIPKNPWQGEEGKTEAPAPRDRVPRRTAAVAKKSYIELSSSSDSDAGRDDGVADSDFEASD